MQFIKHWRWNIEYILYLDVLFAVNFIMDYFAVRVTVWILHIRTSLIRQVMAGLFLAAWPIVVIVLGIGNTIVQNIFTYGVVVILMLFIIDRKQNIKKLIREYIIYIAVCFLAGGTANVIYYNTVVGYMIEKSGFGIIFLLMAIIISKSIIVAVMSMVKAYKVYGNKIYDVLIEFQDRTIEAKALYDSGNTLSDPFYHRCISIIEKSALFGEGRNIEEPTKCKYHIVPFKSLGMPDGIIEVIEVKTMKIQKEKTQIVIEGALLGLYEGKLSGDDNYELLLNSTIFERQQGGL